MKFGDILGETHLNEELSEDYKKVAHKVKIMYKTLRKGGFKIGNLIPDMVPFWTGFEIIDDKDTLITYELPTKYHLTSGNQMLPYELIITGITINCEKHPALADDIDIREDILRKLARKINNALKGTFDEGEQIKIQIRKKHNVPSAYENMVDESVVNDPQEQEQIIKKSKLVYKSFRKGKVKITLPPVFNDGQEIEVVAKYELPSKFKIRLDFKQVFMRSVTIFLPIDSVKFEFDYDAKNKSIENELLEQLRHKIKMKFVHFDSNCDLIFTKYPDAFRNADDHIVKEEESKHTHLIKKIPLVYKALKKGTIELTIHEWDYDRIKSPRLEQIKFHYELPDLYKIKTDDFSNVYPVSILVPEIKITCPDQPELVKQSIKQKILDKLKRKFSHFDLTLFSRPSEFFRRDNGTWVNL